MRHVFLTLSFLLAGMVANAAPINSAQALRNAQAFLQSKGINIQTKSMRRAPSANGTEELAPYYVFNLGDDKGFVIASGDDRAYPVIAYSDTGSLELDNLPENVQYWLDFYKRRIEALKGLKTTGEGTTAKSKRLPVTVVEPMLTSKWDQRHPFNLSCPVNQNGKRCVTGCVATAMAQLMYHHRKYSTRQVMADIPGFHQEWGDTVAVETVPKGTVIDWNNMLDEYVVNNYTEAQAMAVANLMLYCGISVDMFYGAYASGAFSSNIVSALVRYFDYDEEVMEYDRCNYTDEVWERMIYGELAKGNPVVYSGSDYYNGGHAFVLDGCDADGYVHVNWGWGGFCDGYFLLTTDGYDKALDGYSEGQSGIFGAIPYGAIPRLTTQSMTLKSAETVEGLSSNITFPVAFTMTVANLTDSQDSFKQAMGLYKNGQLQSVVKTLDDISNLAVNGSKTVNVSLDIDATLANGVYQLIPLSRSFDGNKWRKNDNYDQILTLAIHDDRVKIVVGIPEVEVDIITFADVEAKRLCVENWDVNGDGELSKQEAAAVTSLNQVFHSNDIKTFDELQYFTGLTVIDNNAFSYSSRLSSVIIPPNVVSIGNQAFSECSDLHSIVIPPNVVSIGEEAFYHSGLQSITIPAAVKKIGINAFNSNYRLEDIQVEAGNTCYDSRSNCHGLMETSTNTLLTGCKNTIIPNGTKVIGEGAFRSCSGLTTISIPNSVTSIGANAFNDCDKLPSVIIPESVTAIGEKAFFACSALTSVTIPKSIRTLAGGAFSYCENLISIVVDAKNPYYDSRDNCNAVMEKSTNKLVTGCQNTVIPQSTESIGDYALLRSCTQSTLVIPSKVTSIGSHAFGGCRIYRIELPEGLKTIGEYAFDGIDELTTVNLPSTVTAIGYCAFFGCGNLASVEARMTTPIDIKAYTFTSQKIASLYVPQGCASRYQSAAEWKNFKKIVEGSIPYRDIIDFADNDVKEICINHWDTNGDRELTKEEAAAVKELGDAFMQYDPLAGEEVAFNLYHPRYFDELQYFTRLTSIGESAFSYSDSLRHVTLPPQVRIIEADAFCFCTNLQAIDLPDGVTTISECAFEGCESLKSVVIPEGVTKIARLAFGDCTGLVSVSLPESLTALGGSAFWGCTNLASIRLPSKISAIQRFTFRNCIKLEYVFIPENIQSIEESAFYGCESLKSVSIPSQMGSIGERVFNDCNALTEVMVKRLEPLPITENTFSNYANATLYVPKGSRNAYMEAESWKLFSKIVELSGVRGDVNNDSKVNVTDVTLLVNHILGKPSDGFIVGIADINGDGFISVSDVISLVNIILNNT